MKAKTIALIGLLAFGGFITLSCIVDQIDSGKLPPNEQHARTIADAEWNALVANAHVMMGRAIVVNDTAIGFRTGALQAGPLGIHASGWYVAPDGPDVVTVVNQYGVTFSGFAGGTGLGNGDAVLDKAHHCIIYYQSGAFVALVIED